MTRAGTDHSSLPADPHGSPFQQPWLYSTNRQKSKEPLWLNTCHHCSNLICMCRDDDMWSFLATLSCSCEVTHVINADSINQWSEEVAQPRYHRLFGTGWSV